jgi:hypothetical protein
MLVQYALPRNKYLFYMEIWEKNVNAHWASLASFTLLNTVALNTLITDIPST